MQLHAVAPIALGDVQRAVGIAQQQIVIRMTGVDGVADAGGNRNLIVSANAKRQLADFLRSRSRIVKASAAPVSTSTSRNSSPP